MGDWQSIAAVSVVAIALVALTLSALRRLRRPASGGCHGDCGCAKTELVRESSRAR